MGRAFATAYLAAEPAANEFFAPRFRDPGARIARTRAAAENPLPPVLLGVIRDQQAALPPSAARQAHLNVLAAGRAAVVLTGQQVGLFLGPLYSFYKAASAVVVARALQAESGVPCVPIFWLQTEDHDFAEIRTATIANAEGEPVRLELADELGGEGRASVAQRVLPAQVCDLLNALAETLGGGPAADEVMRLLRAAYQPGVGPAAAFACLLATLFAEEGLVVFDPRDARVASLAAPIYRDLIENADRVEAGLREREAALIAAGFDVQVPIRERTSLIFFHRDGPAGSRFRIQRTRATNGGDPTWLLTGAGESVSRARLLDALARDPLCFSTSALARPIVEDSLFPTAAYVGGPGEINYFAQLPPLYEHVGLAPPLLIPRARFCVVDTRARRRLNQLGLVAADLAAPAHELRARLKVAPPSQTADPRELRAVVAQRVAPAVDEIAAAVAGFDSGSRRAAERVRKSIAGGLERLIDRYARKLLERDSITARRLRDLERSLYPDRIPQERYYAWPSIAGRLGVREYKELVMNRLAEEPFTSTVHEIHP